LVLALGLTVTASARANPFAYHEHEGFYFRFGGGLAALTLHRETDRQGSQGSIAYEGDSSNIGGPSILAEISVGANLLPKLVLAGTVVFVTLPSATLRLGTGSRLNLDSTLIFALIAPTVDLFPNPEAGFHFGGGLGLAISSVSLPDDRFNTIGGIGVGVTLHGGYDLWVGDDWSLGLQLRGVLARLNGSQSTSSVSGNERDTVATIALSLTALYQ
jgi:hypothetical protein